jgi:hypothetical protein
MLQENIISPRLTHEGYSEPEGELLRDVYMM